jgi:hypothetical protein
MSHLLCKFFFLRLWFFSMGFCRLSSICKCNNAKLTLHNFLLPCCLHCKCNLSVTSLFPLLLDHIFTVMPIIWNLIIWRHILVIQKNVSVMALSKIWSSLFRTFRAIVMAFRLFFRQSSIYSLFLNMWFESLLTINSLMFKDERRPRERE